MTIHVPGDGAALLEGTPVFGSAAELEAIGGFARDVANDAVQYAIRVQNAQNGLSTVTSAGVAELEAKLGERVLPGASSLHRSASDAKRAFDAYASEMEQIHADASAVVNAVNEALTAIRVQAAQIEDIAAKIRVPAPYSWDAGAPGTLPAPQPGSQEAELSPDQREAAAQYLRTTYEWPWTLASSLWRRAIEDIGNAKTKWANLIEDRRDAEQRLTKALGATTVGQLITLSGDSVASRRFTIATGIAGELWGASEDAPQIAKSHPLLRELFGSESGEHAWDAPPPPAEVAAWWDGLSAEDRERLIDQAPWVIGNLPGLPFAVRDAANRKMVEFYQQYPQVLSPEQLKLMADVRSILRLEKQQEEEFGSGTPPVQVVALDMTGQVPKAAVGYGELDSASHTTWQVPGMNSDAQLALESWDEASRNLYRAQNNVAGFTGTNAVVAWLGYDTPDQPLSGDFGVLNTAAAATGAERFAAELDGAHAARSAGAHGLPTVNVLAHSYGTTVATIALTLIDAGHPVDSLTMLGSAGLDPGRVPSYEVLHVKETEPGQQAIYTTQAAGDRLASIGAGASGRGQPNPQARDPLGLYLGSSVYGGGLSFSSEGDPVRHLKRTDGHSTIGSDDRAGPMGISASEGHGYIDRDTQSLDTVAQITTGRIDPELERSFVRTEAECSKVLTGNRTTTRIRTRCEDE